MDIDITFLSILKLMGAAFITYVFLPLALVCRDFVLWKAIDRFILTDELIHKINVYASFLVNWNTNFVGKVSIESKHNTTKYFIDDEEVKKEKWDAYRKDRDDLQDAMNKTLFYIKRRSNLVTWLLKHYKQESDNPVKKLSDTANLREKELHERENS